MTSRNLRGFGTGLLYLTLGCASAYIARGYGIGPAAAMEAGYFPFVVGSLLALIGGYLVIRATLTGRGHEEGEEGERWSLKIIVLIVASVLAFALLVPTQGFVVAVMALVFISGLASGELSWRETVMLIVVLTSVSTLIFIVGLGLSFPVWPSFITD